MNKKRIKRTIESVLDLETGQIIEASEFFSQPVDKIFKFRYKLVESYRENNEKRYVCYLCKQDVSIRGKPEGIKSLHFAHLKNSDDCPIKTGIKRSKEEILRIKYNGAKESKLHRELKGQISYYLHENERHIGEVQNIAVEQVYKDRQITGKWKKPDVSADFDDLEIVFEIQLSTTFLDVIYERQKFYAENQAFILWVFHHFREEDARKFTESDILYSNNRNVFVLDEEALRNSSDAGDLFLKCHYQKPFIDDSGELNYNWESKLIRLSNLTFDNHNYKLYYYDVDSEEKRLIAIEAEKKRQRQIDMQEARKQELKEKQTAHRKKLIDEILNSELIDLVKFSGVAYPQDLRELSLNTEQRKCFIKGIIQNRLLCLLIHTICLHRLTQEEYQLLKEEYNREVKPNYVITKESKGYYALWLLILHRLSEKGIESNERFFNNHKIRSVINCILSLKSKKIIGYNYKKQVQILHIVVEHAPEYLYYYKKAIQKWEEPDVLKNIKLKAKFNKIRNNRQIQQQRNVLVLDSLFPELKEE